MRRSDDIFGLPVFSIREGKEVGKVRDAIISRSKMKVTAFLVEDIAWYGPRILTFNKLQSLGQDALVIETEEDLVDLKDAARLGQLLDRDLKVIKKKVVTDTGKLVGDISSFQIDETNGNLGAVEIKQYGAQAKTKVVVIEKVLSIGPDVLVIGEKARVSPVPAPEKPARPRVMTTKKVPPKPPRVRVVEKPEVKVPEKKEEIPAPMEAGDVEKSEVKVPEKKEEIPAPMEAGKEAEKVFWGDLKEEEKPPRFEETKAKEAVVEEKETGVRKVLEEKRDAFLIGRKATKDIMADDGGVIIKAGEEITPEVIEKTKKANKYLFLSFSAK